MLKIFDIWTAAFIERAKVFCRRSMTILWARVVLMVGFLLEVLAFFSDLVGIPGVSESVQGLLDPKYVPFYLIGIGIITELARRRTLSRHETYDQSRRD